MSASSDEHNLTTDTPEQALETPLLAPSSSTSRQEELRYRRPNRILDRDATFAQSKGRWGVERLGRDQRYRSNNENDRSSAFIATLSRIWNEWIKGDWFHRLVYTRTCVLMFILFVAYTLIVVFFAIVYLSVSRLGQQTSIDPNDGSEHIIAFCDMDINDHMEALYFSLSTMTTIGYGVSDYYFGGCWTPLLLVLWQVCTAITFDAVAVGLLFQKISTGQRRGKTIIFSDKAIVRRVQGKLYLMFRIAEFRKYHLIDASVRVYCIRHERLQVGTDKESGAPVVESTHFVTRQMKLIHPDDSLDSRVLMSIPQVLVHGLYGSSPLYPSEEGGWFDRSGRIHKRPASAIEIDNQVTLDAKSVLSESYAAETMYLQEFLEDRDAEIVVLVEGIDEGSGAQIQAKHSYTPSDLAWGHLFTECMAPFHHDQNGDAQGSSSSRQPTCTIDFAKFHDTRPAPEDSEASPYVCIP